MNIVSTVQGGTSAANPSLCKNSCYFHLRKGFRASILPGLEQDDRYRTQQLQPHLNQMSCIMTPNLTQIPDPDHSLRTPHHEGIGIVMIQVDMYTYFAKSPYVSYNIGLLSRRFGRSME